MMNDPEPESVVNQLDATATGVCLITVASFNNDGTLDRSRTDRMVDRYFAIDQ